MIEQKINGATVEDAWQAYASLKHILIEKPELNENKFFMALLDTAFARFIITFEAM